MDPIAIKITFQEVPKEIVCLFYLVAIFLCTLILSLFVNLFEAYKMNTRDTSNYLYIPSDAIEPERGRQRV